MTDDARVRISEADSLVGRVFTRDGLTYTVSSASSEGRYGRVFDIHVFDPRTETIIQFDSRETFEHWAYGTPVSTKVHP